MDAGAGGMKGGAGGGFVLRQLEIRRSPFAPGTFAGVELGIDDEGRRVGLLLYPAEARQLAAALVALADEIEIADALSRAEIADMLRDEGYRTTERQIRYWVRLGHIPAPIVRKRPGHETPNALYRRDQIPAIRSVAEWYCRKEQP